jgi:hypothetical protein
LIFFVRSVAIRRPNRAKAQALPSAVWEFGRTYTLQRGEALSWCGKGNHGRRNILRRHFGYLERIDGFECYEAPKVIDG